MKERDMTTEKKRYDKYQKRFYIAGLVHRRRGHEPRNSGSP